MNNVKRFIALIVIAVLTASLAQAQTITPAKIRIVLAGDSTVTDTAGWGAAFAKRCDSSIEVINLAIGGRSSKSYRAEGWWKQVLDAKPNYVLIQFGHNDQPGK